MKLARTEAHTTRLAGVVAIAMAVALAGGCSDDSNSNPDATTPVSVSDAGEVSDSDEVVTDLPQAAALTLVEDEGSWFVENSGNVTMSEVVMMNGDATVCEIGTLAPSERATCAEADGLASVIATGLDPQGETVESAA